MESDLRRITDQWDQIKVRLEAIEKNCEAMLQTGVVVSAHHASGKQENNGCDADSKIKRMQKKYKTIAIINQKLSMLVYGSNLFMRKAIVS